MVTSDERPHIFFWLHAITKHELTGSKKSSLFTHHIPAILQAENNLLHVSAAVVFELYHDTLLLVRQIFPPLSVPPPDKL